ncbi:MAG TPA: aldo/keto reductase [Bacteroidales bacterium]|nr:aldo/keto reductase [Bacteroidales bacterium]
MENSITIENRDIPLLGLGTYGMTGESGIKGIVEAVETGYRHFDTAQMYNNEEEVGEGIRRSGIDRKEVFITTKISAYNLDPNDVDSSTRRSIEELGTGYADLLLIHWPTPGMDMEATLNAMVNLKEEGLTRHIGVSNFSAGMFRQAISLAPVICNQVEFSPVVSEFENLEVAREHNLMLTAYSPLGKGRIKTNALLTAIGKTYNKTAAQVALRWLLQLGHVSVIPKASDARHREENFAVFDFELSNEDVGKITSELNHDA